MEREERKSNTMGNRAEEAEVEDFRSNPVAGVVTKKAKGDLVTEA